jgi:acyl dehydratase
MATSDARSQLRHFEDFSAGESIELGSVAVTEQEIIEFARRYDPQTFHVDPIRARESPFGGLIASGWHSVALLTRLWVDTVLNKSAGCGSPGVDEMRFLGPVRPGDVLHGRAVVLETRPSRSRDWRGTLMARVEGRNQDGRLVLHFLSASFVRRRSVREAVESLAN